VAQLHGSYMTIMPLLLLMMIMIFQKDCVAPTAQINNLLAVELVKIYCIGHFTLLRCGYQNTNFQKPFLSSTPGRSIKQLSWAY
jgi:hypothetical protein